MSQSKVVPFTAWSSAQPIAIPQQLLARVSEAIADKKDVAVFCVLCVKNERGNWVYTMTNSPAPAEVGLMAAHEMKQHIIGRTEYE